MKKLKIKIEKLNLNYNLEITLLVLTIIVAIALPFGVYLLSKSLLYSILSSLFSMFLVVGFFNRYDYLLEVRREKLELEFIEVFSYLRIYLSNKENVYRSLKQANEYTSIEMKKEINNFLEKIDEDKSIIPFIEFGSFFKNKVIEEVMISLYQMIDGGFSEKYLNQFISLFDNFKNRYLNEDMNKRYHKMDIFNTLCLCGTGYLMIVILLLIVNVMEAMASGF